MIEYLNYLNLPTKVGLIVIGSLVILQLIGELLEVNGKIVPEFMKVRKYFSRKRQEHEDVKRMYAMMEKMEKTFSDVNAHYSVDNIQIRDSWIKNVTDTLVGHDAGIQAISDKLDKNSQDILSLLIDSKRTAIIDFASYVIDEKKSVTREQFNRIFKLHKEYEQLIEANNLTNGEVDIAIRIIKESYENHMRSHTFVENLRGYD